MTGPTAAASDAGPDQHQVCSQFSRLPEALLARILQALPQQDRLTSCTTVCTSWAAAATAATVDVSALRHSPDTRPALHAWLQRHAGQLESLKMIAGPWELPVCLPCGELQRLTKLDLQGCELHLYTATDGGRSSSSSTTTTTTITTTTTSSTSSVRVLPKLMHLSLSHCKLSPSTLQQLPQLSGVTRLKLSEPVMWLWCNDETAANKRLLQGLPDVASLTLSYLEGMADITSALAASSLTAFSLYQGPWHEGNERHTGVRFLGTPPFAHLHKLKVQQVPFTPEILSSTPLLTRLQLSHCELLPLQQPDGAGVGGASLFLAAVRGLRHLKDLSVCANVAYSEWQQCGMSLSTAQACECASLTASPHLTYLGLSCFGEGQFLPTAALQHMFPAGRQLSQLQQLVLLWDGRCRWMNFSSGGDEGSITTAELRSMVNACPALCSLELRGVVAADADVSVLLQLPATCCRLWVAGCPFGSYAAGVIGQLTQLTCLMWTYSPGLTDAGLLSLTALQGLQSLFMQDNIYISGKVAPEDESGMVDNLALKTTGGQVQSVC